MSEEPTPGAKTPPESPLLDQAALDALLAEASADSGESLGTDYLADETPLGDVDAEGMLIQTPSSPSASTSALSASLDDLAEHPESESVDDLDFDSLLSVTPEHYQTPPSEPEPELPPLAPVGAAPAAPEVEISQAEIDAILGAATATPPAYTEPAPAAPAADVEVSQADIDALLKAATTTPPAYTEPVAAAPAADVDVSQADIDALLSAAAAPLAPSAEVEISQADIDAMLKGASMPPPAAEVEISQSEIDAILNAASAPPPAYATPAPPAEAAAPVAEEAVLLNQDELNQLLAKAQSEIPAAESAPAEPAAQHVTLDQSELEALIAGIKDDTPLAGGDMDAPVIPQGDAISLAQDNVDSLLGSLEELAPVAAQEAVAEAPSPLQEYAPVDAPAPPAPTAPAPAPAPATLSQDMLDALIAAAAGGGDVPAAAVEAVGSENLAAAATAQETETVPTPAAPAPMDPVQDDLDHLIEESRRRRMQQQAAAATEELEARKVRGMPQLESPLWRFLRENGARAVASLAAGLLVGGATFFWLYAQQQRTPDLAVLAMQRGSALEEAMEAARKMIEEGEYQRAADLLQGKIEEAPAGRERTDAAFLRLEALYKSVTDNAPLSRYDEVQTEIDGVLAQAGEHPRVADALHWQALLHKRGELPFAALDNYELLIARHPDAEHMDEILVEAAKLALKLGVPDKAARYADRAVQEYPQSPHFAEAKLLQGDAYARTGQREAARQLYAESLQREESGPLRAETVLRLGRLAFDEGNYDGAIKQIRDYLSKSTAAEGNDAAYLLLAQALRKVKRDAEARDVLNDLMRFFPDSKLAPDATVELSQTLESLGERKSALQIANEGGERFPTNPKILKNLGEMLGLEGNPFSAATTLLAAQDAGADDPQVLLTAARHFRTAGILNQAQSTYNRLLDEYGGSPESFQGGVELAQMYYDRGDSKRALERLEKISTATEGTQNQLPALLEMAKIYDAIGLPERVAEVSRKAAGLTDDPEVLARAASALIKNGSLTEGQKITERIDLSQVPPASAYNLLSELGKSLLQIDPPRGIEKLEEAYGNYPDARKAENDVALVSAYLNAERAAGARRLVLDMAARAKDHPEDAPWLIDAATEWGDYLYNKADYRAAADAYAMADDATAGEGAKEVQGKRTDPQWPRYQRANALLKLNDYAGSLKYYQEIAQTTVPWAPEAAIKADYVRLQQQMRGEAPKELADAKPAGNAPTLPTVPPSRVPGQAPGATAPTAPAG